MPYNIVLRVLVGVLACLPMTAGATSPPATVAGVSRPAAFEIPAKPISTQAQLDAYVRETPAQRSPLNWLTPAARKRFLDGLVFRGDGIGGLYVGDLSYELTREQAYTLLSLFGEQGYALGLDARDTPRAAANSGETSTLAAGYDQLVAAAAQADHSADAIAQIYTTRFSPLQTDARRHALADRDAEFLFRAATLAFKVAQRPAYVADVRADFAELQRRQLVDRPQASDFFDTLIITGNAREARALRARYPVIQRGDVPAMKTASRVQRGKPSVWIVNTERGKRELVRYPFNTHARAQVIVLASTACHFSVQAARDIEADPRLRDVFRENAQWVAPASELTAYDAIKKWNEAYPSSRLGVIHADAELPMVRRIETPTFYFLDHGRVVDTVVGWPKGGNIEAIRRGLRAIDLLH